MNVERRFLIQDRDSGMFLGLGEDGDMDYVRFVNRAFLFEDQESAALTGHAMCDTAGFVIFPILVLYGVEGQVL